ncbi:MAG: transcription termination/antitermination factor NusG [Candidatus Omnitrophica bacterium]|nr:transcription termination/antitermination factor NusG [Candidatus Omnitrophota bacterium]
MKKWYIVHTLSGGEDKVKATLESKIAAQNLSEEIDQIIIPKEQISEVKRGKRKILERKFFPGYILIHMDMNETTWLFVKKTPGVTSFIGSKREPAVVPDEDVDKILKKSEETHTKPLPKVAFERGETVRVIEGPFVNFNGLVEEVNSAKGKLKVAVSIFGRSTPVELEFWQVEKI